MPKCSECGYLALRNSSMYRLEEADSDFRKTGKLPNNHFASRPICFVRSDGFPQFTDSHPPTIETAVNATNQCDCPTEWVQGHSPKEHFEMMQSNAMLQMQQAFQAEQSRLADVRHAESMRIATSSVATAMRGAYLSAGAAIAATLLAAVLAIFSQQPPSFPPTINNIIQPAHAVAPPTAVRQVPSIRRVPSDAEPLVAPE